MQSFFITNLNIGEEPLIMSNQLYSNSIMTGSSFSLYPMCDNFVDIILESIRATATSKVWVKTDDVTTTVRGKSIHVFDVTKAVLMHAAKTGEHVAFNATYSFGYPGDSGEDEYIAEDNDPINIKEIDNIKQSIAAKFSLYPLGDKNYMNVIREQIETMKGFVNASEFHYSTRLDGDALQVFRGLENVFNSTVNNGSSHTVMTVSISANSPSHKGDQHDE